MSLQYFLVAWAWTVIVAAFGYRRRRAAQMATQYSSIYKQSGLNWRGKGKA